MLIIHILIAISSLIYTGFVYLYPTKNRLNSSYAFVAMTLGTGTYLVVSMHSNMVSACQTGLIYLAVVSFGLVAARRKLLHTLPQE